MESDRRSYSCVPATTLVHTPTGVSPAGDLREGDLVAGPDGAFHAVTTRLGDERPSYVVTLSDGVSITLADTSGLPTRTGKDRRTRRRGRTRLVSEVHQLVSGQPVPSGLTVSRGLPLPSTTAILDLDFAYLAGLFVAAGVSSAYRANGCPLACSTGIGFAIEDPMVKDHLSELLGPLESHAEDCPYPQVVVGTGGPSAQVHDLMVSSGIDGLRFSARDLPSSLALAPWRARHATLQGLLDASGSTGTGHQGRVRFTSSSAALTDSVAALVRSLGGYAQVKTAADASTSVWLFLPEPLSPFRASMRARYLGESVGVPARFVDTVTKSDPARTVHLGLPEGAPGVLAAGMVPVSAV